MAVGRLHIDLIFDITDKAKIKEYWDKLKADKAFFREITASGEQSKISIQICHHDEDPPRPCEIIKEISMQNIITDKVL